LYIEHIDLLTIPYYFSMVTRLTSTFRIKP